jgi:hypothetical protein
LARIWLGQRYALTTPLRGVHADISLPVSRIAIGGRTLGSALIELRQEQQWLTIGWRRSHVAGIVVTAVRIPVRESDGDRFGRMVVEQAPQKRQAAQEYIIGFIIAS